MSVSGSERIVRWGGGAGWYFVCYYRRTAHFTEGRTVRRPRSDFSYAAAGFNQADTQAAGRQGGGRNAEKQEAGVKSGNIQQDGTGGKNASPKQGNANQKQKTKPQWADIPPAQLFTDYISLKTAKILSVQKHPDADKLFVETIDDGSESGRVILSGLAPYFAPEALIGADIILAGNVKLRNMRGIESNGMLLASHYTDADGNERVEPVGMPDAVAGTPVTLEGSDTAMPSDQAANA